MVEKAIGARGGVMDQIFNPAKQIFSPYGPPNLSLTK